MKPKGRRGSTTPETYFILDPTHTDPSRIRRERQKARDLRKTSWWNAILQKGICHYCEQRFPPEKLTMDHIVPLARGGESVRGNLVAACEACNQSKKLETPAERLLRELESGKEDES